MVIVLVTYFNFNLFFKKVIKKCILLLIKMTKINYIVF